MIEKDFKIDFKGKKVSLSPKGSGGDYQVRELYSFLMDKFDEPGTMKYEVPIEAVGKGKFRLVNGWMIEDKALRHLKGGNLTLSVEPLNHS